MIFPAGTTVAVADGQHLKLFHNVDHSGGLKLEALPDVHPAAENAGTSNDHNNSAANPSHGQAEEDNFAAGIAHLLNRQFESGKIHKLIVVAAPKTLGEMRKHYSKQLSQDLVHELPKDLTGQSLQEIEKILTKAA